MLFFSTIQSYDAEIIYLSSEKHEKTSGLLQYIPHIF